MQLEEFRKNVYNVFYKKIKNKKITIELEEDIYLYCQNKINNNKDKLYNVYVHKIKNIYNNLTEYVIKKIKKKELTNANIIEYSPWELNPIEWEKYLNEQKKKDTIVMKKTPKQTTNLYTCSRCKNKECSTYQLQTRSADEPMTLFVTCENCNKVWKM